jgi:hypothetical protein
MAHWAEILNRRKGRRRSRADAETLHQSNGRNSRVLAATCDLATRTRSSVCPWQDLQLVTRTSPESH